MTTYGLTNVSFISTQSSGNKDEDTRFLRYLFLSRPFSYHPYHLPDH